MTQGVLNALGKLQPRTDADKQLLACPEKRAWLEAQIRNFPAIALPNFDAPVAICGIACAPGFGEAWMVTGVGFEKHLKTILRQHRQMLRMMVDVLALHRLHMLIDPERPGTARYAQAVGFEFEARLKRMGLQGQDLHMYLFNGE
jgi:hypothetical protein